MTRSAKNDRLRRRLRSKGLQRRGLGRAYTVVEVVMALAVLSIGATGIVAMQKATLIGNVNARNLATANQIASTWLERLRADGLRWRLPQSGIETLNQTTYLQNVGNDFPNIAAPEGEWFVPPTDNQLNIFPGSNVVGDDETNPGAEAFCTNIRLTQLLPNLIRADVRVYWLRNHNTGMTDQYAGSFNGAPLCDASLPPLLDTDPAQGRYHFVYMSTAILRNDGGV